MSELITKRSAQGDIRWHLLGSVSALVICTAMSTGDAAHASDADHPTVWIELGGQLERVQSKQDAIVPPFLITEPRPGFEVVSPASAQRPPRYALGAEAKIVFTPNDSNWRFSADIRFGRSSRDKHLHQQTSTRVLLGKNVLGNPFYYNFTRFGDTATAHTESHAVVDFMVGRDVGLGMWGRDSSTVFNFGVRFVQFASRGRATLRELPDPFVSRVPNPIFPGQNKYITNRHHHSYYADGELSRSFSGIGPTLSLSGSQPFVGNKEVGEISFDWGANAAVLFGRQKVRGSHKTTGSYFTNNYKSGFAPKAAYATSAPISRSRTVVVPNVGGFAGLSLHRANAKVSFGYRADFFFGAMDGGIDTKHASNVGFFGPFATVSVGFP